VFGLQAVLFHLGVLESIPARDNGRKGQRTGDWDRINRAAQQLAATMRDYLEQMSERLQPNSISGIDSSLRAFAGYLIDQCPDVHCVADVRRNRVQVYKAWPRAPKNGSRRCGRASSTVDLPHRSSSAIPRQLVRSSSLDIHDGGGGGGAVGAGCDGGGAWACCTGGGTVPPGGGGTAPPGGGGTVPPGGGGTDVCKVKVPIVPCVSIPLKASITRSRSWGAAGRPFASR
jgi:hypothetical protein